MALEAQNNPYPSILLVEGDPEALPDANPSSGQRRLAVGSDHLLYLVDDTGTKTAVGGASGAVATDAIWDAAGDLAVGSGANTAARLAVGAAGLALVSTGSTVGYDAPNGATTAYVRAVRTSGNMTISNTGSFGSPDTGLDLVIAATAGDLLEVSANFGTAADADQLVFTCSTIVSAAVVNNLASGTSTELPVHSWSKHSTAATVTGQCGGSVAYIVQSGDISGGNVTVRLRALVGAGSVAVNANSSNPFVWWAKVTRL